MQVDERIREYTSIIKAVTTETERLANRLCNFEDGGFIIETGIVTRVFYICELQGPDLDHLEHGVLGEMESGRCVWTHMLNPVKDGATPVPKRLGG